MNRLIQQYILLFFLTTVAHIPAWAQQQTSVGNFSALGPREDHTFEFLYDNATVKIEFCTPEVVRIRTSWDKEFEKEEHFMVVKYEWEDVEVKIEDNQGEILLTTSQLALQINKTPFSLNIFNKEGEQIFGGSENHQSGKKVLTQTKLFPEEHFFGFGERMDFLDRRGKQVTLDVGRGKGRPHIIGAYNVLEANYSPVPFFMSTKGYGIFLHNSYTTHWDMGHSSPDMYSFSAEGGELDYYFIYGPEFRSILDRYTDITGKSPMMNRFAFGLHVGTYSGGTWGFEHLTSTQYVIELAKRFRELGIPLDVLHLDSTWRIFGENGGKGATSFEWRETFDNPKAMFDSLYNLNLNMVGVHLRPRFDNGKNLRLLDAAREKGFVYPEDDNPGEFVNFFDEEAIDWWWDNGVMKVASIGAKFLKTDEGSAFGGKANESDKIGPSGEEIERLHNIFPLAYAKAPYEKFQEYNGLRGMNHTREGYAGIQRYPFIFAGDWPSEWQYFEPVIKAGLNIGISGVGYWAHCMGGFEHKADPELYIRWCQFGLLSPVAHLFGMDHPGYKEPWNYGEEGVRIFRQYDEMRYSLIPYMYSHAWEMYNTGMPLMKALVLEYQDDVNTYNITDQYLLGSSILICPVTTKGAQTRSLYLPEGKWYSHWDGKVYEGKQYVHVVTPIDQIPIFYKSGSIIPTQPVVQYDNGRSWEQIILDVYPGKDAAFDLYEDDGKSLEYQNEVYAVTSVSYEENGGGSTVTINKSEGNFDVPEREYVVRLYTGKAPSELQIQKGKKSVKPVKSAQASRANEWSYDKAAGVLKIVVEKEQNETVAIRIK